MIDNSFDPGARHTCWCTGGLSSKRSTIAGIRSLLSTRAMSVTVFSSVLRELFPHTPASSWFGHGFIRDLAGTAGSVAP